MTYEALLELYKDQEVEIYEDNTLLKGLYLDNTVIINKTMTTTEKKCVLSEELGHYETTTGDILDQKVIENRKQERKARAWGYEKLLPLSKFIDAHKSRCQGGSELADFLDVTEEFLIEAIEYYKQKHGMFYHVDAKYCIIFEPLGVFEKL